MFRLSPPISASVITRVSPRAAVSKFPSSYTDTRHSGLGATLLQDDRTSTQEKGDRLPQQISIKTQAQNCKMWSGSWGRWLIQRLFEPHQVGRCWHTWQQAGDGGNAPKCEMFIKVLKQVWPGDNLIRRKRKEKLLLRWLNKCVFTFHASSNPIEMTIEEDLSWKGFPPADLGRKE